jgi:hypothetical protein
MAWEAVCKPGFKMQMTHLTFQKRLSVASAIRKLSRESGIPVKTLNRWHYESHLKNEVGDNPTEITIENSECKTKRPARGGICRGCGREVERFAAHNKTGKPYSSKSKYYQICVACESKMQRSSKSTDESDGMPAVCPCCGQGFSIPWATVGLRYRKHQIAEANNNGKGEPPQAQAAELAPAIEIKRLPE